MHPVSTIPLLLALTAFVAVAAQASPVPIPTDSGDLQGTLSPDNTVRMFRGVRYAAPPVGDLRWRPPQPVTRATSPLPADRFGDSSIQHLARSRPPWTSEFMVQNGTSENCLFLNLWTPAAAPSKPLPVLVFFHGGAFTEGSGSVQVYDGTNLARRGLIVVTVNYRLGVLGFFADTALVAESPRHSAGNYGLLDQIASLTWVQRNIAAFGGDPARVTVAGQSAGAQSVVALMASPLAKGLFVGTIADSGVSLDRSPMPTLSQVAAAGDAWAAAQGWTTLQQLRDMPADTLLNASHIPPDLLHPNFDGWLLPLRPVDELADPRGSDVPVLTGWNADEDSALPAYGRQSAQTFRRESQQKFGPFADRFLALYPAPDDAQAHAVQIAAAQDRNAARALLWAQARGQHRTSTVFLYAFNRRPPWAAHPEFGSHHTAELPYFFDNLALVHRDYTDTDRGLARSMSQAWIDFATTGRPNDWPPATENEQFKLFDEKTRVGPVLSDEKLAFWTDYLQSRPHQN